MTVRFIALLVLAASGPLCLADDAQPPRIAIYYSFDQTPSGTLVSELRQEFARIAEPAGLAVEWRGKDDAADGRFAEIFTIHFHGACSIPAGKAGTKEPALTMNERNLAEASVSDGHVLPFADVQCDLLRRYLNTRIGGRPDAPSILARALARVTAHEMYHMITGSVTHCRNGIAQAEYSVEDLTCTQFAFGESETEWLRAKTARHT